MPIGNRVISPFQKFKEKVTVNCASDKSITHRAIMFASLAKGQSTINFPLLGEDCISTMECFKSLGVSFQIENGQIMVNSPGWQGLKSPHKALDCGNSGTTARLISGILCAIPDLECTLIGDESLSRRPMARISKPLQEMGADIQATGEKFLLPIQIKGKKIKASSLKVEKASAQVKSAIILAGLHSNGITKVQLPAGSRDHTEKFLRHLGAKCHSEESSGIETVSFHGPFEIPTINCDVPVDPSSAAFFCVLGLISQTNSTRIPNVLNNSTRTGFLNALERMSSNIHSIPVDENSFIEKVAHIEVEGGFPLRGIEIKGEEVPTLVDEIPILAIAAAFAKSPSVFKGLDELRVKESDRLTKTQELLELAGCESKIDGDDLIIEGGLKVAKSFKYDSVGDHRLAMAASVLAKYADGPCEIINADCAAVSFPNFYEELEKFEPGK